MESKGGKERGGGEVPWQRMEGWAGGERKREREKTRKQIGRGGNNNIYFIIITEYSVTKFTQKMNTNLDTLCARVELFLALF